MYTPRKTSAPFRCFLLEASRFITLMLIAIDIFRFLTSGKSYAVYFQTYFVQKQHHIFSFLEALVAFSICSYSEHITNHPVRNSIEKHEPCETYVLCRSFRESILRRSVLGFKRNKHNLIFSIHQWHKGSICLPICNTYMFVCSVSKNTAPMPGCSFDGVLTSPSAWVAWTSASEPASFRARSQQSHYHPNLPSWRLPTLTCFAEK